MSGEIFGWKNRRNGKVYQYKSSDVADAQWIHCGADHYQLKIVLGPHRNDSIVMFDGFHKKVGGTGAITALRDAKAELVS